MAKILGTKAKVAEMYGIDRTRLSKLMKGLDSRYQPIRFNKGYTGSLR